MEKGSKRRIGPLKAVGEAGEGSGTSLFHRLLARRKDEEEDTRMALQQLIVIARLPRHLADRAQVGAHYEKLNFQLSRFYQVRGLLLVYPSCLLHVIESSREVLVAVLKDLDDMQQQPDHCLVEAPRIVCMAQNPDSRMFQQWSYKILGAHQGTKPQRAEEVEEEPSTEMLVCSIAAALHRLSQRLQISKAPPGSVLDDTPELIISVELLHKLLAREELLSPQQYLQTYSSPLNIRIDFGKDIRSSCLTTV